MTLYVGTGCIPATISNNRINRIARSDTPPEMSVRERIKEFFCSTHKSEVLDCIREICHPPAGTTREDVACRFERLRTLSYAGSEDNIQRGRHGENNFCILDANSREILSVTFDNAESYIVECEGFRVSHDLTMPAREAIWSEWAMAAPPEEMAGRAEALKRVHECLSNKLTMLNLGYLAISSLPDCLPPNITRLMVNYTQLTSLPPLPSGLRQLDIGNTPLTNLSQLPPGLRQLLIRNTSLTSLPQLPHELMQLDVKNTLLNNLPPLPRGLQEMYIDNIPLTSLPLLPLELRNLYIRNTSLTSLPKLPLGLRNLYIRNTPLTSLPQLPVGLLEMYIRSTSLTSLPESIARLSTHASIGLYNNPLSERTHQVLRTISSEPLSPHIDFDIGAHFVPRQTRSLHLAVADWLMPVVDGEAVPADRWKVFEQEDNAGSFSSFLDRLRDTQNAHENSDFKAFISSWLTLLVEDGDLRVKTFAMAMGSTSHCEDRVTLAMNNMQKVQLVHNAEKGVFDKNLSGLVSAGREMFRLQKLEQIAQEKVKTLRLVDEVEVYLGYQNRLRDALELTTTTEKMRFFDASGITKSDLKVAESQVKSTENSQFREWILQWEPLHKLLERTDPKCWETLSKKKIQDYDSSYQKLFYSELVPAGLAGNTEAECIIGARAMKDAENAFLEGLRPWVEQVLAGNLEARWVLAESALSS